MNNENIDFGIGLDEDIEVIGCTCGDGGIEPHECPLACEINEDHSLCSCCEYCTFKCGQNI